MPVLLADRPLRVDSRHSAEGSSRYIVGNAKVLLDSADALQEVIDFFREARKEKERPKPPPDYPDGRPEEFATPADAGLRRAPSRW